MHEERHPTDFVSLIAGVAFVLVAIAAATNLLVAMDLRLFSWLLPAVLILIGLGVLGSALRGGTPADDATSGSNSE